MDNDTLTEYQSKFITDFKSRLKDAGYSVERNDYQAKNGLYSCWELTEYLLNICFNERKRKPALVWLITKFYLGSKPLKIEHQPSFFNINDPQKYYVYFLLNSHEEIIYIGKGKGKRAWEHLKKFDKSNTEKSKYIQNEFKNGRKISVVIHKDNLTEPQAFDLERNLIKKYKQSNPLFNIKGGNGTMINSLSVYLENIKDSYGIANELKKILTDF